MRLRLEREPFDYQTLRNNLAWPEHDVRTHVMAGLVVASGAKSILDPAAGDGALEFIADEMGDFERIVVGDISQPNADLMKRVSSGKGWRVTCADINVILEVAPRCDIVVLSEILEHLEDPDHTLRLARGKADLLIASSPVMRPGQMDPNPEHLWQFDADGYIEMIEAAGWRRSHSNILNFPTMYDFQIWVCS